MNEEQEENNVTPIPMTPEMQEAAAKRLAEAKQELMAAADEQHAGPPPAEVFDKDAEQPNPEELEPVEELKPEDRPQISMSNKAVVVILADIKANRAEQSEQVLRSFAVLVPYLEKQAERFPGATVSITLMPEQTAGKPLPEEEMAKMRVVVATGMIEGVLAKMKSKMLTPFQAMAHLQATVNMLADMSSLKGAIVTVVCDEAAAAGFGFITQTNEVSKEDIVVLGEASAGQADQFKDAMRKRDPTLQFPNDKNAIIVPRGRSIANILGRR